MRKAVWLAGRQVEISEERLPELGKGDVRVRVRACGVCQTEVHAVDGVISQLDISALMGHEFSGEMIAVGNEVVGMPVACQASGGFAELVVVRADRIHPLPTGLWVDYGALVEPLACVIGALENAGTPAGKTVVITGAGPMGLLTLQLALRKRAAQIIVSEPNPDQRTLALRLGANQVVDPSEDRVQGVVEEATRSRCAELSFDCSGHTAGLADSLRSVSDGGRVLMIGVHPTETRLPLNLYDFHSRNLHLIGAWGGRSHFCTAIKCLPQLELEPLIGKRFELANIAAAFSTARSGKTLKVLVGPGLAKDSPL